MECLESSVPGEWGNQKPECPEEIALGAEISQDPFNPDI
jgi:hypothetical protein